MPGKTKCPRCGADNDAGNLNCTSCGALLAETAAPTFVPMPAPVSESAAASEPETETTAEEKPQGEQTNAQILQRMKAGDSNDAIVSVLVEGGMEREEAVRRVQAIDTEIARAAAQEQFSFGNLLGALVGGLAAAIIGGVVWGFIVFKTEHEIGYMALGIGFLCGMGVILLSGGRKGIPFQIIAVLCSIVGIAIGKYAAFFLVLKAEVVKQAGPLAAAKLSLFSAKAIVFFVTHLGGVLSFFDVVWVVFAVITAWRIPAALGFRRRGHVAPPPPVG